MKIKVIVTLVLIYIASIIGAWYDITWNYENKWTHINPDGTDVAIMFVPMVNTIFSIHYILNFETNSFFGIEKRGQNER